MKNKVLEVCRIYPEHKENAITLIRYGNEEDKRIAQDVLFKRITDKSLLLKESEAIQLRSILIEHGVTEEAPKKRGRPPKK